MNTLKTSQKETVENKSLAEDLTQESQVDRAEFKQTVIGKIMILLGGLFAASLPWVFIHGIPGAAGFFLLQPLPLFFIGYPTIYVVVGVLSRTLKIKLYWTLLVCLASFALVISLMIAPAASLYFLFYAIFITIGNWASSLKFGSKRGRTGR